MLQSELPGDLGEAGIAAERRAVTRAGVRSLSVHLVILTHSPSHQYDYHRREANGKDGWAESMRRLMLLTCLILPLLVGCDWQLFVFAQPVIDPEAAQEFDIVGEWRGEPDNDFPHIRPEPVTIRPAHDDGSYGVTSKSLNGANTRLRMTVLPNTDSNALVEIEMPFEGESVRILALAKVDGDELYFAHLNGASLIKVLIEERITAKTQRHGIFTAIDCDSSKLVPVISAHWRDLATDSCVLHRMKTSDALRN